MTRSSAASSDIAPLKPAVSLRDCPRWPTMQWLPHEVADTLMRHLVVLEGHGFRTSRVEVVCALILACDPTEPSLLADLRRYKSRQRPGTPSRERLRGVPMVLRMPSPITLRLDCLTDVIGQRDQRIYRHEMIATLILRAGSDYSRLEEDCLAYRQARARDAAVKGTSPGVVLTQRKPRPGARSI